MPVFWRGYAPFFQVIFGIIVVKARLLTLAAEQAVLAQQLIAAVITDRGDARRFTSVALARKGLSEFGFRDVAEQRIAQGKLL